jgi:hypothetical protein
VPKIASLLTMACLALAACSSDDGTPSSQPAPSQPTTEPTQPESPPLSSEEPADVGGSPEAKVESVVFTTADLTGGGQVSLYPDGDQVEGQVTLDECGFDFASEADRVARRQVTIGSQPKGVLLSNEVVAYRDEASALAAMGEFVTAVKGCQPGVPVRSAVGGEITYGEPRLVVSPEGFPVHASIELFQEISTGGKTYHGVVGFQQSGDVVVGTYLLTERRATDAQLAELAHVAEVTGGRLLDLAAASA